MKGKRVGKLIALFAVTGILAGCGGKTGGTPDDYATNDGYLTTEAVGNGSGIQPITCAVVGALLGFLLFNVYPAKVFMGDTGSLALGGFVSASAFISQTRMRGADILTHMIWASWECRKIWD